MLISFVKNIISWCDKNSTCYGFRSPEILRPTNDLKPLANFQVKQETHYEVKMDSDNKFHNGQNKHFLEDDQGTNGQVPSEPEMEDPVREEISEEIADFIQFVVTNKQPDDRFKYLSQSTHHPGNVAALGGALLNSRVKTEGSESEEVLAHAQNCMLKGVTKTAYVMDTLFKHVDKIPKEHNLGQLMSDLNSAMRFFGAANLELNEMRKVMVKNHFNSADIECDNKLIAQDVGIDLKTSHRRNMSRFPPV